MLLKIYTPYLKMVYDILKSIKKSIVPLVKLITIQKYVCFLTRRSNSVQILTSVNKTLMFGVILFS